MNIFTLKTFTTVNLTKMLLVSVKNSNSGSSMFFSLVCEIMFSFFQPRSQTFHPEHFIIFHKQTHQDANLEINWE